MIDRIQPVSEVMNEIISEFLETKKRFCALDF
jgi:hypothetical protein